MRRSFGYSLAFARRVSIPMLVVYLAVLVFSSFGHCCHDSGERTDPGATHHHVLVAAHEEVAVADSCPACSWLHGSSAAPAAPVRVSIARLPRPLHEPSHERPVLRALSPSGSRGPPAS